MTQVMTKECNEGICDHAPFPHKVVESPETRREASGPHSFRTVQVGVRQSVICLACGHWSRPGVQCDCRYDCHNAGINPSPVVLD